MSWFDFFSRPRFPRKWRDVQRAAAVMDVPEYDLSRIEANLIEAQKMFSDLVDVLRKRYARDQILHSLRHRQGAGETLTEQELAYIRQSEANFLDMVSEKFMVVLHFMGDWDDLSEAQQDALRALAHKHPPCKVLPSLDALPGWRPCPMAYGAPYSREEAQKLIDKML